MALEPKRLRKGKPSGKVTIVITTDAEGTVHTSWSPGQRLDYIIGAVREGLGVPNDTTFAERMGASAVVFLMKWAEEIEKQALAAANAPAYGGELKYN